jgi:hypothetical protein
MISTGRQYGARSPMVAQYHPIRDKKVCLFNKITRYRIMSPSRSARAAIGHCRDGVRKSSPGRCAAKVHHQQMQISRPLYSNDVEGWAL